MQRPKSANIVALKPMPPRSPPRSSLKCRDGRKRPRRKANNMLIKLARNSTAQYVMACDSITRITTNHAQQVDAARAKAEEARKSAEQYSKDGKAKFEQYKKETGSSLNSSIDKFDKTVEKKTAEAKSGISSWFGGK